MDLKQLSEFNTKKSFKIQSLLDKATKLNINIIDDTAPYLKACVAIEEILKKEHPTLYNDNVTTILTELDYKKIFGEYRTSTNDEIIFDEKSLSASSYNDAYEY